MLSLSSEGSLTPCLIKKKAEFGRLTLTPLGTKVSSAEMWVFVGISGRKWVLIGVNGA